MLGTVGFDENGESMQQVVTFHRLDSAPAEGAGGWVIVRRRDFGPDPDGEP
ncbi:MAG: hypothetical protein ACT4OQ_01315 [Chloroflexota bacterium]